jgi:hypothetical protein
LLSAVKPARGVSMAIIALAALIFAAAPAGAAIARPSEQLSANPFAPLSQAARALDDAPAPEVTIDPLPLRSHQRSPSFSGTASDTTPVTIEVFSGEGAQGEAVASVQALGTGGGWASGALPAILSDGTYSALARQEGAQGAVGTSAAVTFAIDSESPTVALDSPPVRSNHTHPSFSGTASGSEPITVEIYEGPRPEGRLLALAEASAGAGLWSSAPLAEALPAGSHAFTAIALQPSDTGGPPGISAPVTFIVDTEAPRLDLTRLPSPSNVSAPAFSGTTSEAGEVVVEVFAGEAAQGTPLQVLATPVGAGGFTTTALEQPLVDGTYTAVAEQASALENPAGRSDPVTFTIDTAPPSVTLNAPLSPSANRRPAFSGTAGDTTAVTVEIHSGASAEGPLVSSLSAEAAGGKWISGRVEQLPAWGQYTAIAIQPSSIGNPAGKSAPVTFAVAPIAPAVASEGSASVTRSSAALYGSVDPKGAPVSECRFDYGPTAAYGKSVGCGFVSGISAFPPEGTTAEQVFVRIYGLASNTTYHYRTVALGEGGQAEGADQTFTTLPAWSFGEEGSGASSASIRPGPSAISAARLAALIAKRLVPRGHAASLRALLARGALVQPFAAPVAGHVSIAWYYTPSGKRNARPVRVAAGHATFSRPGSGNVVLRLSAPGRHVLRGAKLPRVLARCAFTPLAGTVVRVSRPFHLAR